MKKSTIFIAGVLIVMLSACKKDKPVDEPGLTGCPVGATCETRFTDKVDVSENGALKTGSYRVFWSIETNQTSTRTLFAKAPATGDSFELNGDDIRAGRVVWNFDCPVCDYILMKPVDGFVKGRNTTPQSRADKAKWLIEAKIVLQPAHFSNPVIRDTVYIKKIFQPNFVYN